MIEIYLLEQLEAFARCGTLSAAAEELHLSQPALTRSMKKFSLPEAVGEEFDLVGGMDGFYLMAAYESAAQDVPDVRWLRAGAGKAACPTGYRAL